MGVDDPAPGVAALEAESELAVGVEVEGDAALAQLSDRGGRLLGQDLDGGWAAEAAAGGDRVGRMAGRRVARLQGSRQAALRPVAGALRERRARDQADAPAQLGSP